MRVRLALQSLRISVLARLIAMATLTASCAQPGTAPSQAVTVEGFADFEPTGLRLYGSQGDLGELYGGNCHDIALTREQFEQYSRILDGSRIRVHGLLAGQTPPLGAFELDRMYYGGREYYEVCGNGPAILATSLEAVATHNSD